MSHEITKSRAVLALVVGWAVLAPVDVAAIITPLTRAEIERAAALARWPRSDSDRSRFHRPYIIDVTGVAANFFAITRIEVITEFRRLELIAEEHARANDTFARGGLRDAQEAIRPWRGRVSIAVQLEFTASNRYLTAVPRVEVALGFPNAGGALDTRVIGTYGSGDPPVLIGGTVEATFDATPLARQRVPVLVRCDGRELTRVVIDFARLD